MPLFYRRFLTAVIQIYKRYIRCKQHGFCIARHFLTKHFHQVRDRRIALARFGHGKAEYLAERDRVVELDVIQRDGYEAVAGVLDARRYISHFVDPLEQVAAKQRALIVHVFGLYEFAMVHFFRG